MSEANQSRAREQAVATCPGVTSIFSLDSLVGGHNSSALS